MKKMIIDVEKFRKSMKLEIVREELKNWCFFDLANCYQYMLGVRIDLTSRLNPGNIVDQMPKEYLAKLESEGKLYHRLPNGAYTDAELVRAVANDLEVLGYEMRESTLEETVIQGTWKCAILNGKYFDEEEYDFHFLRQGEEGRWLQKFAHAQFPETCDENGKNITNPAKASYGYPYHLVGYYMIGVKKA